MPSRPVENPIRIAKAIGLLSALLICQGSSCGDRPDPPTLPGAVLTDIHLQIKNPADLSQGIYLAWDYPDEAKATYFDVYKSLVKDSLGEPVLRRPAEDSHHVVLRLADTSRPFTMYFAVRAVYVEATGQKLVSDSLSIDSITITPSLSILQPATGTYKPGRTLEMEVQTSSDPGVVIRFIYFEMKTKTGGVWEQKQEGWLPLGPDPTTIFGNSVQRDSLTLEQHPDADTVTALFCVVGTESFQERTTGQIQSLGCKSFFRVGK